MFSGSALFVFLFLGIAVLAFVESAPNSRFLRKFHRIQRRAADVEEEGQPEVQGEDEQSEVPEDYHNSNEEAAPEESEPEEGGGGAAEESEPGNNNEETGMNTEEAAAVQEEQTFPEDSMFEDSAFEDNQVTTDCDSYCQNLYGNAEGGEKMIAGCLKSGCKHLNEEPIQHGTEPSEFYKRIMSTSDDYDGSMTKIQEYPGQEKSKGRR